MYVESARQREDGWLIKSIIQTRNNLEEQMTIRTIGEDSNVMMVDKNNCVHVGTMSWYIITSYLV